TSNPAVSTTVFVDGLRRGDWGLNWVKVPVGSHEVCFTGVGGFATPACETVQVDEGVTTEVESAFTALGLLRVTVDPAGLPVTVVIDGVPRNPYGLFMFMEADTYEIC